MRKFIMALAVMLIATPTWATVAITCEDEGGGVVKIDYSVTGEPNKVRAFALDITVDSGATIDEISDFIIGESTAGNPGYGIFPASFRNYVTVDEETGVPDWSDPNYSPLADPCDPDALGGLGTDGITIEMGALYYPADDSSPNAPPDSGTLCKVKVSGECTMSIAENATRGGVVLTDPDAAPTVTLSSCEVGGAAECFPSDHPDYAEWVAVGKPNCWCYPRQCHGDADGLKEGSAKKGYYYVHFNDLNVLLAGWNTLEPDKGPGIATVTGPNGEPGICADFAHDQEGSAKKGYYRVHFNDLNILVSNWNVLEPDKGPGVPPDCGGTVEP
jgi:hypothetical protein